MPGADCCAQHALVCCLHSAQTHSCYHIATGASVCDTINDLLTASCLWHCFAKPHCNCSLSDPIKSGDSEDDESSSSAADSDEAAEGEEAVSSAAEEEADDAAAGLQAADEGGMLGPHALTVALSASQHLPFKYGSPSPVSKDALLKYKASLAT